MHRILQFAAAALVITSTACKSTDPEPVEEAASFEVSTTGSDCICGSDHADLVGCHCEQCLLNGGNPFNPECTCLPLRPTDELSQTYVGFDASGQARPRVGGSLVGLDELKLKRGGKVRGEVLEDDGQEIRFRLGDGSIVTYTYDELDHRMVYRLLKAKGTKDDAEDELKLANFARDTGLYAHSRRHYANVLKLDPAREAEVEEGLAELRKRASEDELASANEAYVAGDAKAAREHLTTILNEFPEEGAAASAAAMLGEINAQAMSATQKQAAVGLPIDVVNELRPVRETYESAANKNEEGLRLTKDPARAKRAYESALSESEKARRRLADLGRTSLDDAQRAEGIASYDAMLVEQVVEIRLNLASLYLGHSKYQHALAEVNEALAVAPGNERALEMRSRVESTQDSYQEGYQSGVESGRRTRRSLLSGYYYGYGPGLGMGIGGRVGYGTWGGISRGGVIGF